MQQHRIDIARRHTSHVPENKRAPASLVLRVHPAPQHHSSSGDDQGLVGVNPLSVRHCCAKCSIIDAGVALPDGEANAGPATEFPVSDVDILGESKDCVVLLISDAVNVLLSLKVHAANLRPNEGNDLSADLGPENVGIGFNLEFEGLGKFSLVSDNIVTMSNLTYHNVDHIDVGLQVCACLPVE